MALQRPGGCAGGEDKAPGRTGGQEAVRQRGEGKRRARGPNVRHPSPQSSADGWRKEWQVSGEGLAAPTPHTKSPLVPNPPHAHGCPARPLQTPDPDVPAHCRAHLPSGASAAAAPPRGPEDRPPTRAHRGPERRSGPAGAGQGPSRRRQPGPPARPPSWAQRLVAARGRRTCEAVRGGGQACELEIGGWVRTKIRPDS